MKPNFTYQSYDYSFLQPKVSYFTKAVQVAASTIGFDVATVEPMNGPVGKLFYFEPVRDINGTWTMAFTSPQPSPSVYMRNHDDFIKACTTTSNYINEWSKRGRTNYTVTNSTVANMIKLNKYE